jgi:hypothetical protein
MRLFSYFLFHENSKCEASKKSVYRSRNSKGSYTYSMLENTISDVLLVLAVSR